MKKFSAWLVLISLIAVLAACGNNQEGESGADENNGSSDNGSEESASLYDQIVEEGVMTVGTEGTYAPFTFHNDEGELTGYDVEVIREVADRMGIEVEFEETQWDSMFAGLNAERFDVIANQVGINEDRLENYDFSNPYTYSSAVVVVPKDNTDINSFEDLEGKQSAQSLTSNYGEIAEESGAELVSVEGLAQSIELIKQGRADVTVNDKLAVLDYINQQGDASIKIAAEQDDVSETAFTFNKGNEELVDAVNEQLEAMREDGSLAEISKEWFGEDVSSQ
ncbi:amino acid ABC transporter substrate-binding protein [Virgibacillus senegalensis]|uniref:amino acid ABC transporter substrate-binding protein n=1 Tax=Virgibacillus senegalensis TaxID=1499679 RepID=UPI00069DA995|nr:amino acid ABC transporter substrate-binding protein [Virgibacillus senegalensis]